MTGEPGREREVPPLVTLTVWGVSRAAVAPALLRMALDRRHVRGVPGLRFAKLLGTGDGRTFTVRDADPLHWALLTVWEDPAAAATFADGPTHRAWQRLARERLQLSLRPLSSRGRWSRREPFGDPVPRRVDGPVAALTRARIRARSTRAFWRAVPPVSQDLHTVPGLRLALGLGEAPVGLQGTFSLWEGAGALVEFAHRRAAHVEVVGRTAREQWYAEELFARFEVLDVKGTFRGEHPLAARAAA
jgi:heme-degrading monooxygenase HmoA